jgi:hypothetical protein
MRVETEHLEFERIGEVLPRVLELTQAAIDRGLAYHVHRETLPNGRGRVSVAVFEAREDE